MKRILLIVFLCLSAFALVGCSNSSPSTSTETSNKWDSSVRFIDVTNEKSVDDDKTIQNATSCIAELKNSCSDPFTFKLQDVQYADSTENSNYQFFLIAYTIGNSGSTSCVGIYNKSNNSICLYDLGDFVYNHEVLSQRNYFYGRIADLSFVGRNGGARLLVNQEKLTHKEIISLLSEFYDKWKREKS